MVGEYGVGKSSLFRRFATDSFVSSSDRASTIGLDNFGKVYSVGGEEEGRAVKLQLWDTSGQGRFCTIIRSYSRGAQGILLVYDITNKWSFEGIDRWLKEVDQVG